jgi:hypothetical protein
MVKRARDRVEVLQRTFLGQFPSRGVASISGLLAVAAVSGEAQLEHFRGVFIRICLQQDEDATLMSRRWSIFTQRCSSIFSTRCRGLAMMAGAGEVHKDSPERSGS